ncbi:MAG: hypothetical protein IKO65_11470 [Victivallales bacterium]|nr:hypothetical protein [Victivallales bacterium]
MTSRTLFSIMSMVTLLAFGAFPPMENAQDAAAWLQRGTNNCHITFVKNNLLIINQSAAPVADGAAFPITLTEAAYPAKWPAYAAELRKASPEVLEIRLASPEWEQFPIPLDIVIAELLAEAPSKSLKELHVLLPSDDWWRNLAILWNLRSVIGLFAGEIADRRLAREEFLREIGGNAAEALREYLRIGERSFLTATALAGLTGRPATAAPLQVFSPAELEQLAAALDKAPAGSAIVQAEAVRFRQLSERLRQQFNDSIRKIFPGQEKQFLADLHGGSASVTASVAVSVDAERLYVALEAEEPRMATRRRKATRRDEAVWEDDCFEIFLLAEDTDAPTEGWQFIVNCNGAIWDGRRLKSTDDSRWSAPRARAEVTESAAGWAVLFSVPWKDLGLDNPPSGRWRANFYRTRHAAGTTERMAWSPIEDNQYYCPEGFGWLVWQ